MWLSTRNYETQRQWKYCLYIGNKKQSIESVPVEDQTLELLGKDFKRAIINMVTELKEIMYKEPKKPMRTMYHQIQNISEDIEYKNNQTEILKLKSIITENIFTIGAQQQIWAGGRKNQQI